MWGGICLGLAAFLQVELGVGCGRRAEPNTVSRSAELDRPITWAGRLPLAMLNGTSATAELEPLACRVEEDCPPWSSCEDRVGRRVCCCGLGYHLHPLLGCVPAKVFPAQLQFCNLDVTEESSLLVTRQLQHLSQHILGHLEGYLDSPVRELNWSGGEATILHHFSAWVPVTGPEVDAAVDAFWARCHDSNLPGAPACDLLRHVGTYQGLNLCQLDVCDHLSTTCSFRDGLVHCTCRHGFFQAHAMDRTCTACESGFWLQNGTCIGSPCWLSFLAMACALPVRSSCSGQAPADRLDLPSHPLPSLPGVHLGSVVLDARSLSFWPWWLPPALPASCCCCCCCWGCWSQEELPPPRTPLWPYRFPSTQWP